MSFTDEDLKRLKWNLENSAPNWWQKRSEMLAYSCRKDKIVLGNMINL